MNKILFSTTSFDTIDNGPALFANLIYNELLENESIDFRVITENLNAKLEKRAGIYRLNLNQTKLNSFFYQFIRIFIYHKEAKRIQNNFNYNVLVYNNAFTGYLSALNFKKPVIVMINDYNRIDLINRGFGFNKNYFKNLLLFYLEKKAALNADRVIVNSKFLKDQIHKMYNIPLSKIKILYKGIKISNYKFKLREHYGDLIHVLFVKGGYQNGGFYDLIEALKLLGVSKFKLTVIGPREIDLPIIKKEVINMGIENFEIKGSTHPDDLKKYFNSADIFCVPSHKEALGVANMEALASGLPVISTNVGGIPEVLDYGNCGWMVEPNNSNALAKAIKECIQNDELRINKSKLGYQHVQQFNTDNLIDNFLNILKEVKS
ncbi:glycosyltransferase family 4 protein [Aureibaculum sp. A20]|uniref:Glycosyltransferase family 4 protein n=1 Tax=Aureibaculum flavum TaxID=2795986 RepID=A0ABS0WRF9_9FLAO|nr:glycosyltransferase family 4 protein [Aureibaculum flavum]MBJ2174572.1 glycosyltransferase family 4 protein [Aureibaculum flavum]